MNFVFESVATSENFVHCQDLNRSGIRRFTGCPSIHSLIRYKQTQRKFNNIDLSTVNYYPFHHLAWGDINRYIIASGVSHHPNDWCGPDDQGNGVDREQPNKKNLFAHLNARYLDDLRKNNAFLLLDQSHEGYHEHWLWPWFHNSCRMFGINPQQVIYVTGNMDALEQYTAWADQQSITDRLCVIAHPEFEAYSYEVHLRRTGLPRFKDHYNYKSQHLDTIKTYNALQKRPRAHRMWLFSALEKAGLVQDGINSMNVLSHDHTYYDRRIMDREDYDRAAALLPMLPPNVDSNDQELEVFADGDSGKYQMEYNAQINLDSWVAVLSEASFAEETCFLSEKIFKPIACCQPFIIFGNRGSLAHLKKLGYRTFHPWIDETYDTLPAWARLDAIIDTVKRIRDIPQDQKLEWYKNFEDIIEHNYAVMEYNANQKVPDSILRIQEYTRT